MRRLSGWWRSPRWSACGGGARGGRRAVAEPAVVGARWPSAQWSSVWRPSAQWSSVWRSSAQWSSVWRLDAQWSSVWGGPCSGRVCCAEHAVGAKCAVVCRVRLGLPGSWAYRVSCGRRAGRGRPIVGMLAGRGSGCSPGGARDARRAGLRMLAGRGNGRSTRCCLELPAQQFQGDATVQPLSCPPHLTGGRAEVTRAAWSCLWGAVATSVGAHRRARVDAVVGEPAVGCRSSGCLQWPVDSADVPAGRASIPAGATRAARSCLIGCVRNLSRCPLRCPGRCRSGGRVRRVR
ncbi:Uncharacterised protein [Nocardia brasiliensis]|nr:Uncharacterised protein [Nocardia brasiliensis]